jgi:hypothetical protein
VERRKERVRKMKEEGRRKKRRSRRVRFAEEREVAFIG